MIHITLGEVLTALIMYIIVHSVIWFGNHVEHFLLDEYHHALARHIKSGHRGKLERCSDEACIVVMNQELQTSS